MGRHREKKLRAAVAAVADHATAGGKKGAFSAGVLRVHDEVQEAISWATWRQYLR